MATINNNHIYEVGIVGARHAGASCAFYLAKSGIEVALFEKKKFPRKKICGDAITIRAQEHLKRMGVLQEILKEKKGNWAALDGIVSPSGIEYYGDSSNEVKGQHLVIVIKREIMDEKIVRAAINAGTKLLENITVSNVNLSVSEKYWLVKN